MNLGIPLLRFTILGNSTSHFKLVFYETEKVCRIRNPKGCEWHHIPMFNQLEVGCKPFHQSKEKKKREIGVKKQLGKESLSQAVGSPLARITRRISPKPPAPLQLLSPPRLRPFRGSPEQQQPPRQISNLLEASARFHPSPPRAPGSRTF